MRNTEGNSTLDARTTPETIVRNAQLAQPTRDDVCEICSGYGGLEVPPSRLRSTPRHCIAPNARLENTRDVGRPGKTTTHLGWIKKGEVKSLSEIARLEGIDKPNTNGVNF